MRLRTAAGLLCGAFLAACSAKERAPTSPPDAGGSPTVSDPVPVSSASDSTPDAAVVIDAGCTTADPAAQRHGSTCLCCHADEFSIGGSVDPSAAPVEWIVVTDARGDTRKMAPNTFSNFFAHFAMTPPFSAIAYGPDGGAIAMRAEAPNANCNSCHRQGGVTSPIHGP
jgi:hypothetical protein